MRRFGSTCIQRQRINRFCHPGNAGEADPTILAATGGQTSRCGFQPLQRVLAVFQRGQHLLGILVQRGNGRIAGIGNGATENIIGNGEIAGFRNSDSIAIGSLQFDGAIGRHNQALANRDDIASLQDAL
ncbi:hypothetical protein D3C85_1485440 [compost metagenome]